MNPTPAGYLIRARRRYRKGGVPCGSILQGRHGGAVSERVFSDLACPAPS